MTTLSYPFTLVAGQPENVNQLNSNLNAVTTWAAGNIDTTNLATSAKPVTLKGDYRSINTITAEVSGGATSGIKYITIGIGNQLVANGGAASKASPVLYLDPADFAVSGLTAKYRLRALFACNTVAPAITFTTGLYPVTVAGAALAINYTLGTVVSGSTAVLTTPSASALTAATGSDFTPPTAGAYMVGVSLSGTVAANCFGNLTFDLQVHHV